MKPTNPSEKDRQLSGVMREWKSELPLPPRFQEGVWRRIEGAQAPTKLSVLATASHWLGTLLARPAMATAYVAVLLAVGATAGWTQAHQTNTRVKGELGQRYVQVLDPYQAPRN